MLDLTPIDGHQHTPGYCSGAEVSNGSTEAAGSADAPAVQCGVQARSRAARRRATGIPRTQIARALGVTDDLLRAWQRHAAARPGARATDVFPGRGRLPSDAGELRRLERENRRLSQENAFLKTAAAYIAKESR